MKPSYEELEQQLAESHRALRAETTAHENTQMQLEKMAAENAGLKAAIEYCINPDNQPEYHDQGMGCGVEDHGYQRDGYSACYYGWESAMERVYSEVIPDAIPETPATDAFLAEVRAQGVDALVERRLTAARLAKEAGHEITARDLEGEAIRARIFAMELRKGVQS